MERSRILVVLPWLASCAGQQSALDPKGPQGERLYELFVVMTVGGTIVFVIVLALALLGVFLPGKPARQDEQEDLRRLVPVGAGAAITVVLLVALVVYSVTVGQAITGVPRDALQIQIVARQWWWEITYPGQPPTQTIRTANELRIPIGRPIEITLESRDVIHSFWVPNLHGKLDAIPGRRNRLWLQADQPGVYRGQCAEFCGLQHAKMALFVVAEPPERFERWREQQLRPAAPPEDELARAGQKVFVEGPCALCHAVRGTTALAAAGPDLTHLASRRSIAAATVPNQRGQLAGWLLDPQHIKPGAFMPPIELDPDALHALLHYLETLK